MISYFINEILNWFLLLYTTEINSIEYLAFHHLGTEKNDFAVQLCLLRAYELPRLLHTSPCFRRVAILLANSLPNVRDVIRCSSLRKNLQLRHLTKYRILGIIRG